MTHRIMKEQIGDKMKLLRYKKLIINKNALVPKGAMEVLPVYKEADGKFRTKEETIFKANDEKLELTTIMVKFGKYDADGMILDSEFVRDEAMIEFMKSGDKTLAFSHNIEDKNRDVSAFIKELYVIKSDDIDFPDYAGSIASTAKFANVEDYKIAKELEFETSIEGIAELEEVAVDKSLKDKIAENIEYFIKYFGVDKIKNLMGDEMFGNNKELKEKYEQLEKEFAELKEQIDKENVEKEAQPEIEPVDYSAEIEELKKSFANFSEITTSISELTKTVEGLKEFFLQRETPAMGNQSTKLKPEEIEIN